MSPHQVDAYLDGALGEEAEARFLDHLIDCAACQAELHGEVQLRDREDALRGAATTTTTTRAGDAPVIPIGAGRRRRWPLVIASSTLAVAAIALVAVRPWQGAARRPAAAPTLALAPARTIEPRLAWAGARAYRPYDPMRSATAAAEYVDPRVVAALVERGDCAGVAATYVLSGELARARQQHDRCGDGADLDADRAGLELLDHAPARALALADRALAIAPTHPVALWNRALALRDLGLGLAAAAAFDRVAELDPPWAEEARRRAADARGPLLDLRDDYQRAVEAGAAMAAGGPPMPLPLARRFPARAALRLDDAIRLATTPARLAELRPLATELDALTGAGLVVRLDAARPAAVPDALRAPYLAWLNALAISDDDAWRGWLAAARTARADALVLGAMILGARAADASPALAAVAAKQGGWLPALYEVIAVRAAAPDDAARRLAALEAACAAGTLSAYPCARVAYQRAELAWTRYQAPATAEAGRVAVRLAEQTGEWGLRWRALELIANAERIRGDAALAGAYLDEVARSAATCAAARQAAVVAAEFAVDRHDLDGAVALLRAHPACEPTPRLVDLYFEVELASVGRPLRPKAELDAALASVVTSERFETDLIRYLRARLALGDDPQAADALAALLTSDAPESGPGRPAVAQLAAATLAVAAAADGRWADGVAALARATRATVPTRCALAVASDSIRYAAIALGPDGHATGAFDPDHRDAGGLPPAVVAPLAGCAEVAVLATAPWLGRDLGLPPALRWWFVLGPGTPPRAAPPRRVIVGGALPPAWLALPPVGAVLDVPADATLVRGAAATVAGVASAAATATVLEIHAHTAPAAGSDAPALALTDSPDGWAVTAEVVRGWRLTAAPVVLLAECNAAATAGYEQIAWGLPAAFVAAGARAVVAADGPIPDREAGEVFAALGDAAARGVAMADAVAELRAARLATDPTSWVRRLVVFQ
ncbi:MAG: zf-HC2 domain-containing protein [Myxococcales bacterium]|nr:zf-HC2 domain-containing protein [Myxococcales bacterium]